LNFSLPLLNRFYFGRKPHGVSISDNGIGIDAKYYERIFKPFERLHGKDEFEGTGIGLAICDKILQRHSGKIEVKSRLQMGTTFILTIPEKQLIHL